MRTLLIVVTWFWLAVGVLFGVVGVAFFFLSSAEPPIRNIPSTWHWAGIAFCSFMIATSIGLLVKLHALRFSVRTLLAIITVAAVVLVSRRWLIAVWFELVRLLPYLLSRSAP